MIKFAFTLPFQKLRKLPLRQRVQKRNSIGSNSSESGDQSKFSDIYTLGEKIGKGNFSTVRICKNELNDEIFAVKLVLKNNLSSQEKMYIKSEAKVLQSINHPNILNFYAIYNEKKAMYLITEYLTGGSLYDRIMLKSRYSECDARAVAKRLFDAIGCCHDNNIVHRDLKPSNLLLVSKDNDVEMKIADFGFAKIVPTNGLRTKCGTQLYIAPEIYSSNSYGNLVDIWSIGIILYVLLSGRHPFISSQDDDSTFEDRTLKSPLNFSSKTWLSISDSAKDLISKLLVRDPSLRINAKEALNHEWFQKNIENKTITQDVSEKNIISLKENESKKYMSYLSLYIGALLSIFGLFTRVWLFLGSV